MWSWLFRYAIFGPIYRHRVKATITGLEHLPKHGAYILAIGSHTTEVESAVVASWLRRRQIHFYAKAAYWQNGWFMRWFMNATGQIPMERGEARKALEAIDAGVEMLRQGEVLAIYPEGTRSTDGKLHGAYPGVAYTAIRAGGNIPIIPVGLIGMEAISPNGSGFVPKRGRMTIAIGEPILASTYNKKNLFGKMPTESTLARTVSDKVMKSITALCGKAYDSKKLVIPTS